MYPPERLQDWNVAGGSFRIYGNCQRGALHANIFEDTNAWGNLPAEALQVGEAVSHPARRCDDNPVLKVTLQIVRDWVLKFNAHGPDGLIDRKPPGQPPRLNDTHRAALAAIIQSGPIPAIHGVVRWRIIDLCQWIYEEFRVVVAKQTLSRELRAMDYRKLSARPRHHAQAAGAIEDF